MRLIANCFYLLGSLCFVLGTILNMVASAREN